MGLKTCTYMICIHMQNQKGFPLRYHFSELPWQSLYTTSLGTSFPMPELWRQSTFELNKCKPQRASHSTEQGSSSHTTEQGFTQVTFKSGHWNSSKAGERENSHPRRLHFCNGKWAGAILVWVHISVVLRMSQSQHWQTHSKAGLRMLEKVKFGSCYTSLTVWSASQIRGRIPILLLW